MSSARHIPKARQRLTHLVAALALMLSPALVMLTHAPNMGALTVTTTDHAHHHGPATSAPDHNAADHEHQLTAIDVEQAPSDVVRMSRLAPTGTVTRSGIIRDGPRRPPRTV